MLSLVGDDPFMTITNDNISQLVESAIIHKADNCFKIIMEFYKEKNGGQEYEIDWFKVLSKILTFYLHIQS